MNDERLLKLADLLEADAANPTGVKFDLEFWGTHSAHSGIAVKDWEVRQTLKDQGKALKDGQPIPVDCNTAACAVGLACISGAFAADGLTYRITINGDLLPVFGHAEDWSAAADFFGLTDAQSHRLFSPCAYSKKTGAEAELEVAKRIRGLVDGTYIVDEPTDDDGWDDDDDDGYDPED